MPTTNPVLIQNAPRSRNQTPPLFLIHDATGLLTSYFKIGSLNRRVYGIWDPKFNADGIGSWQSVRDIAEAYIKLIRKVVIRGEIVLGGWSFGGIIATEISHILASKGGRGLRVSRILLIDSVYPRCTRPEAYKEAPKEAHAPALPGVSLEVREKLLSALYRATCLSDNWEIPQWSPRDSGMIRIQGNGCAPTPPPAILIRANEMVPMAEPDEKCPLDRTRFLPQLGWEDMMEGFVTNVMVTPGNHYSVFDDKYIDSITRCIAKALEMIV